jgi:CheY-like chemotaxis protein
MPDFSICYEVFSANWTMKKILIADELSICRQLLSFALRHHGYEVVAVEDGASALEAVKKERPDLAILGLHLPKIDGLNVIRTLRANPDSAKLPIFILTHAVGRNPILEAGQLGVQAYILKSQFDLTRC